MTKRYTRPGQFFLRSIFGGPLETMPDLGVQPDEVVSRRVVDFPDGRPPENAVLMTCGRCGAAIASERKFPGVPRICLQCSGIEPLPIDGANDRN